MGDRNASSLYPGRDGQAANMRRTNTPQIGPPKPFDPTEDDPVEHNGSLKAGASSQSDRSGYVVAPSIQVKSEFPTLTRSDEPSQSMTCIVIIELPSRRPTSHVPGPVMPDMSDMYRSPSSQGQRMNGLNGLHRHETYTSSSSRYTNSDATESTARRQQSAAFDPRSPTPDRIRASVADSDTGNSYREPPAMITSNDDSPFKNITEDLRARIVDWKGHPLSGLGPLQMFDLLCVRRDALVREFHVYLFKEAIICVEEEKKRSLGRFLGGPGGFDSSGNGVGASSKGVLKLKGRIYIRHIKQVTDTSVSGELSLTIDMEDEKLESFILIFRDRSSLEAWKANISSFVAMHQQSDRSNYGSHSRSAPTPDIEEFGTGTGSASKAMRMLSGSTGSSSHDRDSLLNGSIRSSSTSQSLMSPPAGRMALHHKLSPLGEDEEMYPYSSSPTGLVAPHLSSGPSNSLTPVAHSPMDLILVMSLPPPTSAQSTANLKARVIRETLEFVIASLGPKDRLSLVTFEVGVGGRVRKTPFLSVGRGQSRNRLLQFVNDVGTERDGQADDVFLVRGSKEDKTDVVTAVNHGTSITICLFTVATLITLNRIGYCNATQDPQPRCRPLTC